MPLYPYIYFKHTEPSRMAHFQSESRLFCYRTLKQQAVKQSFKLHSKHVVIVSEIQYPPPPRLRQRQTNPSYLLKTIRFIARNKFIQIPWPEQSSFLFFLAMLRLLVVVSSQRQQIPPPYESSNESIFHLAFPSPGRVEAVVDTQQALRKHILILLSLPPEWVGGGVFPWAASILLRWSQLCGYKHIFTNTTTVLAQLRPAMIHCCAVVWSVLHTHARRNKLLSFCFTVTNFP